MISHLFIHQSKKREAIKDENTRHGTMDKSQSEEQICVSVSIFCIVRKNWPYYPTTTGSYGRYAGRKASRQNTGGFQNFYNSLQVKLFGLLFNLISLQCYYNVITAVLLQCYNCISVSFCQVMLNLRCVLKRRNSVTNFFMSVPTIRY